MIVEKYISKLRAVLITPEFMLSLFTILCLLPFINKPYHIDDPLFVWAAKQIQAHPFDFYGFNLNWNGYVMPMWQRMQNPPLTAYFIAIIGSLFGFKEIVLHTAYMIPAIFVVLGTYAMAKNLCEEPIFATLISMVTPVFLLSATTIMCDVLMLAFYIWAIIFWMRGLDKSNFRDICLSSLLIALCCLTKYYGVSLIPLLFVYSVFKRKHIGVWLILLIIPILILMAYQVSTYLLYGVDLFKSAISYSSTHRINLVSQYIPRPVTGIVFIGGCLLPILCFMPILYRKRTIIFISISFIIVSFAMYYLSPLIYPKLANEVYFNIEFMLQYVLFAIAGIFFILLAIHIIRLNKDSNSILLFLWALGTLTFVCFINWSVNGRSVLPLMPIIGILLIRQFNKRNIYFKSLSLFKFLIPLAISLIITILIANADYKHAESAYTAANSLYDKYKNQGNLWFQGHWGFQYYIEGLGAKAAEFNRANFSIGDIIIIPDNNSATQTMNESYVQLIDKYYFKTSKLFSVMNMNTGAGFYSDIFGQLPYSIFSNQDEMYEIYKIIRLTGGTSST